MTFSEEQIDELGRLSVAVCCELGSPSEIPWRELTLETRVLWRAAARAVAERAVEMAEKARVEA